MTDGAPGPKMHAANIDHLVHISSRPSMSRPADNGSKLACRSLARRGLLPPSRQRRGRLEPLTVGGTRGMEAFSPSIPFQPFIPRPLVEGRGERGLLGGLGPAAHAPVSQVWMGAHTAWYVLHCKTHGQMMVEAPGGRRPPEPKERLAVDREHQASSSANVVH